MTKTCVIKLECKLNYTYELHLSLLIKIEHKLNDSPVIKGEYYSFTIMTDESGIQFELQEDENKIKEKQNSVVYVSKK